MTRKEKGRGWTELGMEGDLEQAVLKTRWPKGGWWCQCPSVGFVCLHRAVCAHLRAITVPPRKRIVTYGNSPNIPNSLALAREKYYGKKCPLSKMLAPPPNTTCTPPRLHVPVAHALNTSPEIQVIQVYPWQILVFPARNYPTSVGHVYQNTLRYWG
ncbi:hypothetical protein V8E52_010965 [Russula decolorans]